MIIIPVNLIKYVKKCHRRSPHKFWIFSFLIIIKSTALPAILYGLEFTQTLKINKVKCNYINNSIAMACKIALGVGKKTSNLKY